MHQLSTNDLRFIAKEVLNKVDFDPKEYGLDEKYLMDVRDNLLDMAASLDSKGEFYIESVDDCGCDHEHGRSIPDESGHS